jgi:cytochrome P450
MSSISSDKPLPAHVPPNLVRPYPFLMGSTTTAHPHDLVAEIHNWPRVFYAMEALPGREPGWVLSRAEDLRQVYQDNEHFSVKGIWPFAQVCGETWESIPIEIDPPRLSKYRALLIPLFASNRVAILDARARQYARDYLLAFRGRGACEFMSEFTFEFPIKVFLELMGLPLELTKQFLAWEMDILHAKDRAEMKSSTQAAVQYLRNVIEERKKNPGTDLLSNCVVAEIDGQRLSDDELLGISITLFMGGLDTVSTAMGLQVRHLAEHPEQQDQLRRNPDLIPAAIEEMLRAYSAVSTFRTCKKEVEIQGVKIMPGDRVVMGTHLTGRDSNEYENPDEIRFERDAKHLGFGYGAHACFGMHLARREMKIALQELLALIPPFKVKSGVEIESYLGIIIQPSILPLVWDTSNLKPL